MTEFVLDESRTQRLGFGEAVFCEGKSAGQIAAILDHAQLPMLLTRLDEGRFAALSAAHRAKLDYDAISRTAYFGEPAKPNDACCVGVVTAGTSDVPVALEAVRTLRFNGESVVLVADIGVAGLWRLMDRLEALRRLKVLIVVAGMDGALPTVLGGLVPGVIVAVPSSVGYGVATGGHAALHAILSSCAPGIAVVNIDNGYGAACMALRVLGALRAGQP
jgi:NCAIR mutase (PurE)-related protein